MNFRDESLSKTTHVSSFRSDQEGYYLSIIEAQDNGLRPFINVAYSDLRIPHAELIRFQQAQETPSETRNSIDDIIEKLTLKYDSDESFVLQFNDEPGKAIRYDDRALGFKNNRTKEWKFFLGVLKNRQPIKVNERKRKRMREIEKKLKNLIGNLNHIDIPKDYDLFYCDKTDGHPYYRTRFNTLVSSQEITFIDKNDFDNRFEELLNLIKAKKVDASTEATFFKFLELGKQDQYLSDQRHKKAMETFNIASTRHGEIERLPGTAIETPLI